MAIPGQVMAQASPAPAKAADPLDWFVWRGPHFDGTSPETGLIDDFDPKGGDGSNVLWKRDDLGTRSTPIVMGGKLYTLARADQGTNREGERVVCLDASTGETLWENRFNVWLSDVPDTRVAWSSVLGDPETGNIYALGVCGYFQCIDGSSGKTIWSLPMHEFFGMLSTYGGRTNFPVICEDLVIVGGIMTNWANLAKPAHRLVGFDKRTGAIVWINGTRVPPDDTNYSTPTVTVIAGQKSLVFGSGDGSVWSFQPRTGRPIWNYPISLRGLNAAPLVIDDTVYMGHGEENKTGTAMGTVLAINAAGFGELSESSEQWRHNEVMMGRSAPVRVGKRVFIVDDRAKLRIMDAESGEDLTRDLTRRRSISLGGSKMHGSPIVADGKIYFLTERGDWSIWRIDEEAGLTNINKGKFPSGEMGLASPICSHGNVYFTTTGGIYCLRDAKKTPGVGTVRTLPSEQPVAQDMQPAYVQVVPAEVLLQSGKTQQFQTRLFNARGQLLKATPASFSVEGLGSIDAQGQYKSPADAAHQGATIVAKVGDLQGQARVRLVPPLPWKFTFDDLSLPPITWVGARYRHVIRDIDGNKALVKVTTIPKGTRSRCWFGPSDLANYTIQAEVRGSIKNSKMPDVGIIAGGYTLDLQGANQKLQVRTWVTQLRMAQTVEFAWKPDIWYVMKLRTETQNGQARLLGKVWPRDQDEPAEWTVQAVDPQPVESGSPGLFGNAKDAEIAFDNIQVYSNQDESPTTR